MFALFALYCKKYKRRKGPMAIDIKELVARAQDFQKRLIAQGQIEDAFVIDQLIEQVEVSQTQHAKTFYTTGEAAKIIGVASQTVKNWVARGILQGYRLGNRIVIPRDAIDSYRPIAEAMQSLDPVPDENIIIDEIRRGRRPVRWPETEGDA
jgi:excisionase family DNA binding protein